MAEDEEDWYGLKMTILKSLANFFKLYEQRRSSFKGVVSIWQRWLSYCKFLLILLFIIIIFFHLGCFQ